MPEPRPPRRDEPEIADASSLFDDEPAPRARPVPKPRPAPAEDDPGGYALEDFDEPEAGPAPAPPVLPEAAPRPRRRPRPEADDLDEPDERGRSAEEAEVDRVWSRGAEWGSTLAVLAVVGAAVAVAAWLALSIVGLGLAVLVLLAGLVALGLLSYPIVVTLERPVRLTPEQALKDFFGALSHHFPHYQRMWLLLSDRGRETASGDSFAGFREHWKARLAALRGRAGVKSGTPLDFEVVDYKSEEKSAGKSANEGTATVNVVARGDESGTPIATYRYKIGFVRGPDRMWYLNRGTLPEKG
jgi:hypothetical protein